MIDKKIILLFLFISFFIFSSRWITSYYFFDELTSVRLIFESVTDGYYYFPLVKYLSIFDFNNSFNPNYENLNNLMIPFYSIFVHSFFFKLLGNFSFIFIEYLSISIFLIFVYRIFQKYYSVEISILFSLIIFLSPFIFSSLPLPDSTYLNALENNIYSLRFPRPLITSVYLILFLYLISSFEKNDFITKKNFFLLGVILAATLSSFYYFFFIQVSIMFFYIIYRYGYSSFNKLLTNWGSVISIGITFLIFSLPLIINLFNYESEYSQRLGIIDINFEQKKILLSHYLSGYLKKEFLIFFSISTVYLIYINKKELMNFRLINLFYIFFLGSIFAPIFFISITNKSGILYHFNNTIIIFAYLLWLVIFYDFFNKLSFNFLSKFKINIISVFLIILCMLYYINSTYINSNTKFEERTEFNKISKIILKNHDLSESTLMTFENSFMVWAILNDIKYLNLTNFIITPKKDEMIENDLIKAFKFLDLDSDDFNFFISNKKTSWRYVNYDLSTFFFYKYMANPIRTFNNSKNFDEDVYKYIKNSSPINFEQSVIPNEELNRLNNKFMMTKLENYNYPDIIILNKQKEILKDINKIKNYCKVFEGNFFILFLKKKLDENCN